MMSAFVIAIAYWHGELTCGEAARCMAMARLLLEYPRWRWGEDLNGAIRTINDISRLSDLCLREEMQALLPGIGEISCCSSDEEGSGSIEGGKLAVAAPLLGQLRPEPEETIQASDNQIITFGYSSCSFGGPALQSHEETNFLELFNPVDYPMDDIQGADVNWMTLEDNVTATLAGSLQV
jgi:hypothetical protein